MKIRLIVSAALVALLGVAVPATASAAVRTLAIEDPQGDATALSGPVLDLKSLAVRYDDAAGTLRVVWSYYNDVRGDESVMGSFGADAPVRGGVPNDAVGVHWAAEGMRYVVPGSSWAAHAGLSLAGSSGVLAGTVTVSQDGRVVTAEFSHTMLAGHDWQSSWGGPAMYGDEFGDRTRKFWFDGYSDPNPPPIPPPVGPVGPGPTPPGGGGVTSGDQGMTINGGALYTNDPDVTLSVIAPNWAKTMRVANDGGFRDARTVSVASTTRWRLAESGSERLPKTAYLRFGNDAQTFTDDIILDQTAPTVSSATLASPSSPATSPAVAAASSRARTYEVRLRAKDQTSGVAKLQFANSRRRPGALRRFERNSRYKGASAPKYVRVRDRAGNFSRWRSIR